MPSLSKQDAIVIVGAGVFGLSTALSLAERGFGNVTVLDRMAPPVPDGSSCDISRIVRSDYSDPFYARLAKEALQAWRTGPFASFYHNSGFVLTSESRPDAFLEKLKGVLKGQDIPYESFDSTSELKRKFPSLNEIQTEFGGYLNPNAGWADAAASISLLATLCTEKGVSIITGPRGTVTSMRIAGSRVEGVNVALGAPVLGSKVILATGAWTNSFLDLTYAMSSSGQPVGFIQLTPEEAYSISRMPTLINMTSGFFVFPPTPGTNILKVACHSHGFENRVPIEGGSRTISAPKRDSNNATSFFIPDSADAALRHGLKQILPRFADRPWMRRRLCWYTDTPEGNFVVDYHPSIQGLFLATGGAGHPWKVYRGLFRRQGASRSPGEVEVEE
ncbi:L-pipecolate oxidase [Cladophialophora carrionii]|uniref:L-pipecolate oxidase n=1 Tax=Cladophialophora carrionii TaxID=86049 RepID=A0A1C1CKL3_9EURO|nr:L-pipecolate oxidase [Cladophialophora carrionii]